MSDQSGEPEKKDGSSIFSTLFAVIFIAIVAVGTIRQLIPTATAYFNPTPVPTHAPGQVFPCPLDEMLKQTVEVEGYLSLPTGTYFSGSTNHWIWIVDTQSNQSSAEPGDNPHIIYATIPNDTSFGLTVTEDLAQLRDSNGNIVPWIRDVQGVGTFTTASKVRITGVVTDKCWIAISEIVQTN